ncbi:hypothetical protein HK405_007718, partial [Cladochytrium tenue]
MTTPSGPAGGVVRDLFADFDPIASAPAAPAAGGDSFARSLSPSSSAFASPMLGGGGGGGAPGSGPFDLQPSFARSTSASGASAAGSADSYGLPLTPEESRTYAYYFKIADLEGKGAVSTNAAVAFLSRSQLDRNVLSQIWTLANPDAKSSLDGPGFYRAMKLISLAQAKLPLSLQQISARTPLPKFEGIAPPIAVAGPTSAIQRLGSNHGARPISIQPTGPLSMQPTGSGTFSISNEDRNRYFAAWNTCSPTDGFVSGDAARELFLKSGLTNETLRKVWLLVDNKGAMKLNLNQFMVAMYIISRMKKGTLHSVPPAIPPSLWNAISAATSTLPAGGSGGVAGASPFPAPASLSTPNSTPAQLSTAPGITRIPSIPPPPGGGLRVDRRKSVMTRTPSGSPSTSSISLNLNSSSGGSDWVVKPSEKATCDAHFDRLDTTKKGYLEGAECYEFFVKSNLDRTVLAQIWDLACFRNTKTLSREEFAVAMHLIRMAMAGEPLPDTLPDNFIPPAYRTQKPTAPSFGGSSSNGTDSLMDVFADLPTTPAFPDAFSSAVPPLPSTAKAPTSPVSRRLTTLGLPASKFLSMSSSNSAPGAGFLNDDRSSDLEHAKAGLTALERQMDALSPAQEELRAKRLANEEALKEVTRKKQELTLKLSQASATFETESAILAENQSILVREQGQLEIGQQELEQAQQIVDARKNEKDQLMAAIEAVKSELAECNQSLEEVETLSKRYKEETDSMRPRFNELHAELKKQLNLLEINRQVLTSAQLEYEQLRSDLTRDEARLEAEKRRLTQLNTQIAVQTRINEQERAKLMVVQASLKETVGSVTSSTETLSALKEAVV